MRNLKSYFHNPFVSSKISNENLIQFGNDHISRMISNNVNNQLDTPIANTTAQVELFSKTYNDIEGEKALRKAYTMELNILSDAYKNKFRELEAEVFLKYGRGTSIYTEFFPNGLTVFTNAGYVLLESLFSRLIASFNRHGSDWDIAFINDLETSYNKYIDLHKTQTVYKANVSKKRTLRNKERAILEKILFENLLNISILNLDSPEAAFDYFDQSIIRRPVSGEQQLPAAGTNNLSGMITDTIDDEPVINATIEFPELDMSSTTDQEGEYSFNEVPLGTHEVIVICKGFDTYKGSITIKAGDENIHDIILAPVTSIPPENNGV